MARRNCEERESLTARVKVTLPEQVACAHKVLSDLSTSVLDLLSSLQLNIEKGKSLHKRPCYVDGNTSECLSVSVIQ